MFHPIVLISKSPAGSRQHTYAGLYGIFFSCFKNIYKKRERISVEADAEGRIRPLKATVVIAFYMVAGRDRGTRNNCGTHRCERVLHLQTRLNASLHNLGRGENSCVILHFFGARSENNSIEKANLTFQNFIWDYYKCSKFITKEEEENVSDKAYSQLGGPRPNLDVGRTPSLSLLLLLFFLKKKLIRGNRSDERIKALRTAVRRI